jgi:hypothetical protein
MADWQPPKLSVMELRECHINYCLIKHRESITCLALNLTALKWRGEVVRELAVKRAASILAGFSHSRARLSFSIMGTASWGLWDFTQAVPVGGFSLNAQRRSSMLS